MQTLSYAKETVAAKEHNCDFCGEKIKKGDKYQKSTHVHEGTIYDWRTHDYCQKVAHDLKMYEDCDEGVSTDDFFEIVSNKHDDILIGLLPEREHQKYSDIIQQIHKVKFHDKLSYVIRYLNKPEVTQ